MINIPRLLPVLLIGATLSAQGAFPSTIPVQGRLTLANGAVVKGTQKMTFRIYDAATNGSQLWTEAQGTVSVTKGVWKVELGGTSGFPSTLFAGGARWLGIQVGTDAEMVPRIAMSAQAFSKLAQDAVDVCRHLRRPFRNRKCYRVQNLHPQHRERTERFVPRVVLQRG